jgi:hypothetical protein
MRLQVRSSASRSKRREPSLSLRPSVLARTEPLSAGLAAVQNRPQTQKSDFVPKSQTPRTIFSFRRPSLSPPLRQFRSGLRVFCFVGSALNKQTLACDSTPARSAASVSDHAKSTFCDLVVLVTGITVRRIQSRRTKTVSKVQGFVWSTHRTRGSGSTSGH